MFLINYFKEVYKFRSFLFNLSISKIKSQYAQTELGVLWGIINPFTSSFGFTIIALIYNVQDDIFNRFVFTLTGFLPLGLFNNAFLNTAECYLKNVRIIRKIKFPRIILILSNLSSKFLDFFIGFVVLLIISFFRNPVFDLSILLIPVLLFITLTSSIGAGLLLIKPIVNFRDFRFLLQYLMPTIMLLSPVLYSSNNINSRWIEIYSFNPLVSVIEGFRAILNHTEIPWEYILKGGIVSVVIFFFGLYFFSKNEYKLNDYL
jgi:lipopolysaccharide transport system permease protein